MNLPKLIRKIRNSKAANKTTEYYREHKIKINLIILALICSGMWLRGIMQQPQINRNKAQIEAITEEIEYEKNRQLEVEDMRDIADTDEYIEKIAREKLGMIKADERIFIDVSKSQTN